MSDSAPGWVEPTSDYLGFVCVSCGETFSIIGPLDPVEMPPDKPLRIGARGPMPATCPKCGHRESYTIDRLIRFSR
jgi:DNA-directed RNA polymerase subunit RPC12/RpoP